MLYFFTKRFKPALKLYFWAIMIPSICSVCYTSAILDPKVSLKLRNMVPPPYRFPWNVGSYIFYFCLFWMVYILYTSGSISSSLYTVSTTAVLFVTKFWVVISSSIGSCPSSLSLSSYLYTSGTLSTCVVTPVIPVVVLVLLAAYAYLLLPLNSSSNTDGTSIIFFHLYFWYLFRRFWVGSIFFFR